MYEGKDKTYYKGFAKNADEFVIAAFVNELTAPDEAPYMTVQLSFSLDSGWSSIVYDDDVITDYTDYEKNGIVALSQYGKIFNAQTGSLLTEIPETVFSHMRGIHRQNQEFLICGDSGNFFRGPVRQLQRFAAKYYSPVPGAEASLEERVSWATNTKFFNSAGEDHVGHFIVTGSQGSILVFSEHDVNEIRTGFENFIVDQCRSDHSDRVYMCGHNPTSEIGYLGNSEYHSLYVDELNRSFNSIEEYKEAIWVVDRRIEGGVFFLRNGILHKASFSDQANYGIAVSVHAAGNILWALFEKAVVRFDGENWQSFKHPDHL